MTDSLLALAERLAESAQPREGVEAYVIRSSDTEIEVFDAEVESLSVAGVEGIGVRVIRDARQGYAWAGSHDPSTIEGLVSEARDNASFGAPDQWEGLATPDDAAGPTAELDLWDDGLAQVATDAKVTIALDLEARTRAADPRIRGVESTGYRDSSVEVAVANSLGVSTTLRRTMVSAHAVAMAGDGDETQTGYGLTGARSVADLDLDMVPRDAAQRSTRLLGARPIASQRMPVVLDPLVTRSFLGLLASAFNGEALLKGRSLFEGRIGEAIAATAVTIVDDPTDARALGASPSDSEGVPTRCNTIVADGELVCFLHNLATGRRSGDGTTGSATRSFKSTPGVGIRALRVEPGALGPDEILAAAGTALYVQSVSGLHSGTNPVSGAFSVGAEGLMVRDGALAEPVREITIASTLQRILLDVSEIGSDLTFLPGSVAGQTVLVADMAVSGSES